MNRLDRELQRQRMAKAIPFVPYGSRLLDVGSADGRIFLMAADRISGGVGLDLDESLPWLPTGVERVVGRFPEVVADRGQFDVVTMLAVVEHLEEGELARWARASRDLLNPGGRVIITMPSPLVDPILDVAVRLRVLHGMDSEAHHGASPTDVEPALTEAGFQTVVARRFQLGLNHIFVFESRK